MATDRPYFDAWIDDDGSGVVGTIWNKAEIKKLIDGGDGFVYGGQLSGVNLSIGTTLYPTLPLATIDWAGTTIFSPAPGRIDISAGAGGLYLMIASVIWAPGAGARGLRLLHSALGVLVESIIIPAAAYGLSSNALAIFPCAAGANVQIQVNSTEATTVSVGRFGMTRL